MTITISFEFKQEEVGDVEREALRRIKANDAFFALKDIDDKLRELIKYQDKHEFQPIRDFLWETLKEREIENLIE